MRSPLSSLRVRLILLLLLALLPAFVLAQRSYSERHDESEMDTRADALLFAQDIATQQEQMLARTRSLLVPVANVLGIAWQGPDYRPDRTACDAFLAGLLADSSYANIGVVALNGDTICSAVPLPGPVNLADRQYVQDAIRTRQFAVGNYQVGRITGRPSINAAYPIVARDGTVGGVVFAAIDLASLAESTGASRLPEGSSVVITDRDALVLWRIPDAEAWIGRPAAALPGIAATAAGNEGTAEAVGLDGVERLYAFTPLHATNGEVDALVHVGIPTTVAFGAADSALLRNQLTLLAISAIALGIAWVGSTRAVLAPIRAFIDTTSRIADGDLAARTGPPYPGTELGDLGLAIDNMAAQLQRQRTALTRLTDELEERVQERTAELEAVNRELETFSYSVSHDLRAPLRAIDGFSQTLARDYADKLDERGRDRLQRTRAAAQRLGSLIDDLLQLSRTTRATLSRDRIDLAPIARAIATELRDGDPQRNVEFDIPATMPVDADASLMRAALQNLIQNAWKFTSRQDIAHIEVGETTVDGGRAFFVRDDGAGFEMEYAGKLFGAFQRLHTPSEFEGNGIGLATVQRIVHRHGGRIWAEGAPEQGATFYFTLPAPREQQQPSEQEHAA